MCPCFVSVQHFGQKSGPKRPKCSSFFHAERDLTIVLWPKLFLLHNLQEPQAKWVYFSRMNSIFSPGGLIVAKTQNSIFFFFLLSAALMLCNIMLSSDIFYYFVFSITRWIVCLRYQNLTLMTCMLGNKHLWL